MNSYCLNQKKGGHIADCRYKIKAIMWGKYIANF